MLGDLTAFDQVLATQCETGQPAPLEACAVPELVGGLAQVVLVPGRLGQAAGLPQRGSAGKPERERDGACGLPAAAQFGTELHDQADEGGQALRGDGAGVDDAGPVDSRAARFPSRRCTVTAGSAASRSTRSMHLLRHACATHNYESGMRANGGLRKAVCRRCG